MCIYRIGHVSQFHPSLMCRQSQVSPGLLGLAFRTIVVGHGNTVDLFLGQNAVLILERLTRRGHGSHGRAQKIPEERRKIRRTIDNSSSSEVFVHVLLIDEYTLQIWNAMGHDDRFLVHGHDHHIRHGVT